MIHGVNRLTGDMDIFILSTSENADKVLQAINDFGFESLGFTREDLMNPDIVVQMGRVPLRIDLLSELPGLTFAEVFQKAISFETAGTIMKVIHITDFIINKEIVGRHKDLMDVSILKKIIKRKKNS